MYPLTQLQGEANLGQEVSNSPKSKTQNPCVQICSLYSMVRFPSLNSEGKKKKESQHNFITRRDFGNYIVYTPHLLKKRAGPERRECPSSQL